MAHLLRHRAGRREIPLGQLGSWLAERGGPKEVGINVRPKHQCKVTESTLEDAKARAAVLGHPAAVKCYECHLVFRVDTQGRAVS